MNNDTILGISAFYHDSAICMIRGNNVVACLQEERFSRVKHDSSFPVRSLNALRDRFALKDEDVISVVFYDKPVLKMERIFKNLITVSPKGFSFALKSIPITFNRKIFISDFIRRNIRGDYNIYYLPHHISHAVASFLPSDFSNAAFMINDGVGEWDTSTYGICTTDDIHIIKGIEYPHSLGLLYSAMTYFCGFRVNSGEYKLMGLAPYGRPVYRDLMLKHLIDIKEDGSYRLNMDYFTFQYGSAMCGNAMEELLGIPVRSPEDELTADYSDIAASVQDVLELALIKSAIHVKRETGQKNLVMGGGIALNCVANTRIMKESGFENVFIQPAAGDAGGALGAALYAAHYIKHAKMKSIQNYSYLGTDYSDEEIKKCIINLKYKVSENPPADAASLIARGNIVGWFQGRMEYGPRALGSRSILGDPRDPHMQRRMNLKIKFRESFRPFAPSIMDEYVKDYFHGHYQTPYMLTVSTLKENRRKEPVHIVHDFDILSREISEIPAVIHADFSSRLQSVTREQNSMYYELLDHFRKITGIPLIINTSFNVRGQPIVESPRDAVSVFLNTGMDYLVIGGFVLKREDNIAFKEHFTIENLIKD